MTSSYKDAGVDIEAGNALVAAIGPMARATHRPGVMAGLGGFAAAFDPKALRYQDPLILSCTDGVGTKVRLAAETGMYEGIGIDLVAMCVNDLVVQGAEPLFFLDYFATGALQPGQAAAVIASIAKGCVEAGCALIGGETAEMPGVYKPGDFDVAGFSVGMVERQQLISGQTIAPGDVVLGMPSSGFHSNGYSLVRKIIQQAAVQLDTPAPFADGQRWMDVLLRPTRIYVRPCLAAAQAGLIKGMAHITGGGFVENIPRVLPDGVAAAVDLARVPVLPEYVWIRQAGKIASAEMLRTFNCGIGMVVVVDPADVQAAVEILGADTVVLGEIIPRADRAVVFSNEAQFLDG